VYVWGRGGGLLLLIQSQQLRFINISLPFTYQCLCHVNTEGGKTYFDACVAFNCCGTWERKEEQSSATNGVSCSFLSEHGGVGDQAPCLHRNVIMLWNTEIFKSIISSFCLIRSYKKLEIFRWNDSHSSVFSRRMIFAQLVKKTSAFVTPEGAFPCS
jgi:hypothetical protein